MLTFILLASTLLVEREPAIVAPALEITVSIAPSSLDEYQLLQRKSPETYTCKAYVIDPESHLIIGNAELVVSPGGTERTSRPMPKSYALEFGVTLKSRSAEAVVTVKRGEQLITRQRSTVYIKPVEGVVPLR